MRERDVEAYFARRVKDLGGEVRKVKWVGRRGAPDRVAFFQGQTWWVELKAPGMIPEPHQIREHERMQAMGQSVFVIDSKDMVDTLLAPYSPPVVVARLPKGSVLYMKEDGIYALPPGGSPKKVI